MSQLQIPNFNPNYSVQLISISPMFSSNRKRQISEESIASSRNGFNNEDDSKLYNRTDAVDNINSQLNLNFNQIVELLTNRKLLLLRKIELMYEDNDNRIEALSRARLQDLKNEAKLLRDQKVMALVDNTDYLNNIRQLLKRITDQSNFSQFEHTEKNKGKKYYDSLRQIQNDLAGKTKRYEMLCVQLQKLIQKQRASFVEIEQLEAQMVTVLRKKDQDYLRRADQLQDDIDRRRSVLHDNANTKDRKKEQIKLCLSTLLKTIEVHEKVSADRKTDIEGLFGGSTLEDFDRLVRQFQNVVERGSQQRGDRKQRAVQQLMRIANGYQGYIQQLSKERQGQAALLDDVAEGLNGHIKTALIQRAYFQEISADRFKLTEVLKKCKLYKALLDNFEGDRVKLARQISRITQLRNSYLPRLKSISSETSRREQLKKELGSLFQALSELEQMEKKAKQQEYTANSYILVRQVLEREMDEAAQKGNLGQYKSKMREMEKIQRDVEGRQQSFSNNEYQKLEMRLNTEAQNLNSRYKDIISTLLVEDEAMNFSTFITKLWKRISLQ